MKPIDQTKIFQQFKGQWVILDKTRTKALAADFELKNAITKFNKKHKQKRVPSILKVPTELVPFVGTHV